jgi:hypothetical protein
MITEDLKLHLRIPKIIMDGVRSLKEKGMTYNDIIKIALIDYIRRNKVK